MLFSIWLQRYDFFIIPTNFLLFLFSNAINISRLSPGKKSYFLVVTV